MSEQIGQPFYPNFVERAKTFNSLLKEVEGRMTAETPNLRDTLVLIKFLAAEAGYEPEFTDRLGLSRQ